jgi:MFS superfamily sulfate permease-like transporter
MFAPTPASPADEQSVRATLRSPRRLRREVFAGLVVALALIPEAIAFSIIAGVDPRVGLFASFTMAVTIAIAGGRPAMISAANIWDASSVATLDAIAEKFKSRGKTVILVGMNDHSAERHAQLSGLLAGAQ